MSKGSRDDKKTRISSSLARVGSPPLVMMGSDQYNIEDEAWADTMDPKTGSVFYVDPVGDPESTAAAVAPKPPGSPLLVYRERTSSAGEPARVPHDRSPRWRFRKMLTSMGSPSRRTTHDDIDLNSISEPDLRGSPKISRNRHKHVNPFTTMHNGSMEPYIVPNIPPSPTLTVHINLQQFTREWKSCCLKNLGIIPVKPKLSNSTISLKSPSKYSSQEPVVVKELLPESVASKKLLPGDRVVSVNGTEVNQGNVDVVLARVGLASPELVLQVLRESSSGQPSATTAPGGGSDSELVKLLSRKGSHLSLKPVNRLPHLVMYLTLNTAEDDEENKDIVYMYPNTRDSTVMNKLYHLRALCLTLTDVMTSSVASGDCSCTNVNVDGQLMSFVTIQYNKEMVLLAVPTLSCNMYEIKSLARQVEKVLCFLYQSPQSAFSLSTSKQQLDYLFGLFFEQLFTRSPSPQSFHFSPMMSLPVNLKVKLSCALTSLDSADFSSQVISTHTPTSYNSLGSCIFHKGSLLCNHLPFDDLKDVVLFSTMHSLLKVTSMQKINQLVIWRKVYLQRLQQQSSNCKSCFMLAVGLGHTIVYQLMEPSSSSSSRTSHDGNYINAPDAVIIDKTRSLIMELDAKGILEECESCHVSGRIPCLQSIDAALLSNLRSGMVKRSASLSISDLEEVTNVPHSPTKSKGSFIGMGSRRKTLAGSLSAGADFQILRTKQPYMLTTGLDNVLFHYISLNWTKGVFISPAHTSLTTNSHIHEAMVDTFGKTCTHIQEALLAHENQLQCSHQLQRVTGLLERFDQIMASLAKSLKSILLSLKDQKYTTEDVTNSDNESDEEYITPERPVLEQGVLVQCPVSAAVTDKHSKHIPKLSYWIVGRRLPESGKEFYVCFQDTVPQNAVELAFRLHFGSVD